MKDRSLIEVLRTSDCKLYFILLLTGFIPTIYTTIRVFYLGQLPNEFGFNIASQLTWVNLIYEIFDEALLLPMFFFVGNAMNSGKKVFDNFIKTATLITFLIYLSLSTVLIIFAEPITQLMAQNRELISATVSYIRLESIAKIFIALVRFFTILLITAGQYKKLLIVLIVQMSLNIILDIFLVSNLPVSFDLGVNGIAYTNIIVNSFIVVMISTLWYGKTVKFDQNEKLSFFCLKDFIKIGSLSGIESLIRNLVFMFMVLRMVNVIGEQGTFWVANNFIWGWLLIPIIQLGEIIKKDCSTHGNKIIHSKMKNYIIVTTTIIFIWLCSIPFWDDFMENILQISNSNQVLSVVLISLGFYVVFAYNNIIDSVFYGLGRTDLMLIQSICVNIIYYGIIFALYFNGVFVPTLNSIAIMFGTGIVIDSVITIIIFLKISRKQKHIF